MRKLSILWIVVFFSCYIFGQENQKIAFTGQKGIFILAGTNIVNEENPVNGISAYLVERRDANTGSWETLKILQSPKTKQEFMKNLKKATLVFPKGTFDNLLNIDEIWARIQKYPTTDSLTKYSAIVPLQLALGNIFFDNKVKTGVTYEYRISVKKSGQWVNQVVSTPVGLSPEIPVLLMNLREKVELSNHIRLELGIRPRNNIAMVQVKRRENFRNEFEKITPGIGYRFFGDTLVLKIEDTLVKQNTGYEYILLAFDFFGNQFVLPDTIFVKTFSNLTIVPLHNLRIDNKEFLNGNVLSWKLDGPGRIANIRVFRSADFDGKFEKIANVPIADTSYVDETALPMVKYWYYLDMEDITGDVVFKSAKIFGMYKTSFIPEKIYNVTGRPVIGGVEIRWNKGDVSTRGYYVYRAVGNKNLQPVTEMITDTFFIDKSKSLTGNISYRYAIQSENTSYLKSNLSEPVSVIPGIDAIPASPAGIQITVEKGYVQILWQAVNDVDPSVTGYNILRRTFAGNDWKTLNKNLVLSNQFKDTTVQSGVIYEYTVQSVNQNNLQSDITYIVTMNVPFSGYDYGPPTDIKITSGEDQVVITWMPNYNVSVKAYKIYRKEYGTDFKLLTTINDPGTETFSDKKVQKGKLYIYQISSLDKNGKESRRSNNLAVWY
ncbi:MAG: hypothetical protein JXB00_00150 [Bacteroidales bacterium]|nr:hypothetical protein [Bacteroidales bacterium]